MLLNKKCADNEDEHEQRRMGLGEYSNKMSAYVAKFTLTINNVTGKSGAPQVYAHKSSAHSQLTSSSTLRVRPVDSQLS
jgi:hypothetical protein